MEMNCEWKKETLCFSSCMQKMGRNEGIPFYYSSNVREWIFYTICRSLMD